MAAIVYFLLAAFAFVQVFGDTPAHTGLQDLVKDGRAKFDKAMDDLMKLDAKEIGEAFKVHIEKFSESFTEFGKQIDEQVKSNPDISHAMKNLKTKVDEAVDIFKKDNPETAKKVEEVSSAMKRTFDSIAQEVERNVKEFSKVGGPMDAIRNSFEKLINQTLKTANDVKSSVDEMLYKKN